MTTCDHKNTATLQVELCFGLKHTRRALHWSRSIDWPNGPRQLAHTRASLPWTERPEQLSTTLGDSTSRPRGAWKTAQYGALLGVAMRLASRATRRDSLQIQRINQWLHLPWMESLARLSNTHG